MLRVPKVCLDLFAFCVFAVLSGAAQEMEARGKIEGLFPDKQQLVLTDAAGKSRTIHLEDNTKVVINNRNGALSDLQVGDQVVVLVRTQGEKTTASEIRCKRE